MGDRVLSFKKAADFRIWAADPIELGILCALLLRRCCWRWSGQAWVQHWIWMTVAVLALAVISYLAMPPVVVRQATAL